MTLSYIDLSPIPYGGNRTSALQDTIETAQFIEDLGFKRIWLAEHHNAANFAGRVPEVVIPIVADRTKHIRVGSGAVLLNHYSPFKVAEVFSTLTELFPGRIDLGIGRATTGPYSDLALQRNRSSRQTTDDSMEQLEELLHWFTDDFPKDHAFSQVKVYRDEAPEFYLLGSSSWSARAAAQLGLAYAFSGFINPSAAYDTTQWYKGTFQPNNKLYGRSRPYLILSISVYAGETDELALRLSAPMQQYMRDLYRKGQINEPLKPEDEAVRLLGNNTSLQRLTDPTNFPKHIIGKASTVARELKEIAKTIGVDEFMIQPMTANHAGKLKSMELLTRALDNV
ncbi:MAG: MsnO8 family LLM class oxidoreductase [Sphingobacterium sp.]|jgi:luciferase family oxidoreductase group 1|nr:MsnO8 family LLM class oxidoreductase [Sphingobacterium sp.]